MTRPFVPFFDGHVDVAPVSSVNLGEMIAENTIDIANFRIIHQSADILGAPLVYAKSMVPALKQKIKALVLDAHNHINVSGYGGLLERYVDPVDSQRKHLESYLRPQWGWMTLLGIITFVAV